MCLECIFNYAILPALGGFAVYYFGWYKFGKPLQEMLAYAKTSSLAAERAENAFDEAIEQARAQWDTLKHNLDVALERKKTDDMQFVRLVKYDTDMKDINSQLATAGLILKEHEKIISDFESKTQKGILEVATALKDLENK